MGSSINHVAHWGEPLHKLTVWYNSKILWQKWSIYTTDSKNPENPENVESGWKSGSGIPEKKFFLKFFFNCEQFLLNTFLSKMIIYPKKICFLPKKVCFLHFSYLPPSATEPNCINNLCSKSGLPNGKEFDPLQVPTRKNSGKKPDPENPGKIRIWNFLYLGWDFENGHYKLLLHSKMWIFFCDSHKFWHFWHHNFWLYIHEFSKNQLDILGIYLGS